MQSTNGDPSTWNADDLQLPTTSGLDPRWPSNSPMTWTLELLVDLGAAGDPKGSFEEIWSEDDLFCTFMDIEKIGCKLEGRREGFVGIQYRRALVEWRRGEIGMLDLNISIALWLAAGGDCWVDESINHNCRVAIIILCLVFKFSKFIGLDVGIDNDSMNATIESLTLLPHRMQIDYMKHQTRFVSRKPAKFITSTIEVVAESMGLKVHSRNYEIKI